MFNPEHILEIEDKVINRVVYPLHTLQGCLEDNPNCENARKIKASIESLQQLVDWVRKLRPKPC